MSERFHDQRGGGAYAGGVMHRIALEVFSGEEVAFAGDAFPVASVVRVLIVLGRRTTDNARSDRRAVRTADHDFLSFGNHHSE